MAEMIQMTGPRNLFVAALAAFAALTGAGLAQAAELRGLALVAWVRRRAQKSLPQIFDIARQGMKRPRLSGRLTHALAQLGRKAGGPNLAGTKRDGLEHRQLPGRDHRAELARAGAGRPLQQIGQPGQGGLVQGSHPIGIKGIRHHQRKQPRGV